VQIQGIVKQRNSAGFIASDTPFKHGFEKAVIGDLLSAPKVFCYKLKLLERIIVLLLADAAVNHAVKGLVEITIKLGSLKVETVGVGKVTLDSFLETNFSEVLCVVRMDHDCVVEQLLGLL
jgi:hypothetical protein